MNRFVHETFQQSFLPTIGVDFRVRTLMIDDYQCKIQIWLVLHRTSTRSRMSLFILGILLVKNDFV